MRILGLSAFHRDAAAALVVDGRVVAAAQEERFTRLALDPAFPQRAIRWCLAAANVRGGELDRVVFYEKPLRKMERVLARSLQGFPRTARTFSRSAFLWLGERLWIRNRIAEELGLPAERVLFVEQARAQLAGAYYASPWDDAALLLLDDVCEWTTTALGRGRGPAVELLLELRHPHSLGLLASALTQYLGFAPGEDEHKLEALAERGEPRFTAQIERLFTRPGPLFELRASPFRFDDGAARLFGPELEELLGPARRSGDPLRIAPGDAAHADLAASVQRVLEEQALALAHELRRRTGSEDLCLAGLLAQNRSLVARLAADGPFRSLFVPAAPGKAGGAPGAALYAHHVLEGGSRRAEPRADSCAWGEPIEDRAEPGAQELGSPERALDELASRLLRGELAGWAHGAMEFGARSRAHRVALAFPRDAGTRSRLHAALRHVEPFLPCRLAVPARHLDRFFDLPASAAAAARHGHVLARPHERLQAAVADPELAVRRAWPQAVEAELDPELHALLERVERAGAAPLLWLTDLALRGSPLVRSEAEAVEAFGRSELDFLVAGTRLYAR